MLSSKKTIHLGFGLVFLFAFSMTSPLLAATKKRVRVTPPAIRVASQQVATATVSTASESQVKRQVLISSITISGDYFLPKSTLLTPQDPRVGEPFVASQFDDIVSRILLLGTYKDASWSSVSSPDGQNITIIVKERPQIGNILIEGAGLGIPSSNLKHLLHIQEQSVFNLDALKEDLATINAQYTKQGFIECRVSGVDPPEYDGDPLVIRITEKLLEEIQITGNRSTKPYVILREMDSKVGRPLNSNTLKEDFRKIFNLNYFTSVKPQFLPGSTPTGQILLLNIEEKRNGSFSFGGGYSATYGFNFFTNLFWDNFFGMGQLVSLNGDFGRLNTYQFRYYNPWMWSNRQSFGFRLWSRNGGVEGFNPLSGNSSLAFRNEVSNGVAFEFGLPYSYNLKFFHNFKYESVRLIDQKKAYTIQSYTFITTYDTRDVFANPTQGVYYSLSLEKAFDFFPASLDFARVDLDLRHFYPIVPKQVLATRLALGHIQSSRISDADLFAREYYRVGGANTVRGYDDYHPFAYGADQVLLSMEYRFILDDAFQVLLFIDAGAATTAVPTYLDNPAIHDVNVLDPRSFRVGKGIGTRITIPILGSIRLDLGFDDHENSRIHFSLGQTF